MKRKSDNKIFAAKIVRTSDEETIFNIKFEFEHLKNIKHKYIIDVYELLID